MKFTELTMGQRCGLSEFLDLKVDEHTDLSLMAAAGVVIVEASVD